MADLDAELLALAGDASSDEEDAPMNISGASSMSPDGRVRGGSAGRKTGGRRERRGDQNDSEEEGEASSGPGSPDSLQSAPMDESDSDSDTSPANMFESDHERYPLEGKFINATDRAEIMAMPEIKREELLAERAQEVERDRQNTTLRQLIRQRETDTKKYDKKRKAGTADLDESHRKTSRQRTKVGGGKFGESSSGIDNLKRARAEKDDRQRRRKEDNERTRERRNLGMDEYSDQDRDADSELEWDDEGQKKNRRSLSADFLDAQPAGYQDIQHCRISRSLFAKVCFYPGFEEAITGCYVRISIGLDRESQQNIYRMALIKGFVEGKPYAMETENGKRFMTNQYIRAAHGKSEKSMPFIQCSESAFAESEWTRYQKVCQGEGVPIPTKPKLRNKVEDVTQLVNRSWTEAELQEKLKRSGALNNKVVPIHRTRINSEIKAAQAAGDEERVEELRAELEKLEGPKLAFNTSMTSVPKKAAVNMNMNHRAQQERIALLNMENRRKNIEEVRQAQINERRAAKRTEAAIARGEVVAQDTSRRMRTRAKFTHDVSSSQKKEGDESGTASGTGTPKMTAKSVFPSTQKFQNKGNSKGLPGLRRPVQDDDIIGSIDLGIDLDLEI